MTPFDPDAYGSAVAPLLRGDRLNPLDPGRPDAAARPLLERLARDGNLGGPILDREAAAACQAGLWLLHNYLDEAHALAQDLDGAEGSYWHALMHRREPDFANSKYWSRRVGQHPIFEPLRADAARLAADQRHSSTDFLKSQSAWDPFAFVDLCAVALAGRLPCTELCQQIQRREWELLFDYCFRLARGIER
jgi:hypothetical protein